MANMSGKAPLLLTKYHATPSCFRFPALGPLDVPALPWHVRHMLIYKILRAEEWAAFQTAGKTSGAPVDLADGFIHFSTAVQARETAAKHFAGVEALVLAAFDAEQMGPALKWEPSRGGDLFPHLYRDLTLDELIWHTPLPLGPDGHDFPENMQ